MSYTIEAIKRNILSRMGGPISDPSQFIGRQDLLDTIRNGISRNNYFLLGEAGIGKTSLQYRLLHMWQQETQSDAHHYVPVYCNVEHERINEVYLFHTLYLVLIRYIRERKEIPEKRLSKVRVQRSISKYEGCDFEEDLKNIIDLYKKCLSNKSPKIIILLDGIDLLDRFPEHILMQLRTIATTIDHVSFVFSGVEIPKKISSNVSEWWNFFEQIPIKPFDLLEIQEIVLSCLGRTIALNYRFVRELADNSGGIPRNIFSIMNEVIPVSFSKNPSISSEQKDAEHTAIPHSYNPVSGVFFYGRKNALDFIFQEKNNWGCIYGTKKIGKTSLFMEVFERTRSRSDWLCLYWDLTETVESKDFFCKLWNRIENEFKVTEDPSFLIKKNDDALDKFRRFISTLDKAEKTLVLLLDEAEILLNLENNTPGFLSTLHDVFTQCPNLRIYLTGSLRLREGLNIEKKSNTSCFFSKFAPHYLGGLSESATLDMLQGVKLTRTRDQPCDGNIRSLIEWYHWSGGHPAIIAIILAARNKKAKCIKSFVLSIKHEIFLTTIAFDAVYVLCRDRSYFGLYAEIHKGKSHVSDFFSKYEDVETLFELGYIRKNNDNKIILNYNFLKELLPKPSGKP